MHTDLWNFCLNTYARPGMEAACLRLQEDGINVCLLLCVSWLEQRSVPYHESRLRQLTACAEPLEHQVVQPLRRLRTEWRKAAQDDPALAEIRRQIKALELNAERELLQRLEQITQTWPAQPAEASGAWLQALANTVASPDRDALQLVRAAITRT